MNHNDLDQALRAAFGELPRPQVSVGFRRRLRRRVTAAREARQRFRRRRWLLLGYGLAAGGGCLGLWVRGALDLGDPWALGTLTALGLIVVVLGRAGGLRFVSP